MYFDFPKQFVLFFILSNNVTMSDDKCLLCGYMGMFSLVKPCAEYESKVLLPRIITHYNNYY